MSHGAALNHDNERFNGVKIVHQVYGLFGDGKPMSLLFVECQRKWKTVAEGMSAHYHLWTSEELEALVCQKYPQYWDVYKNVRYPVMRVDLGRWLILHCYGGLYADCDTEPNRQFYKQVELALPRIDKPKVKRHPGNEIGKSLRCSTPKSSSFSTDDTSSYVDMEVIVATRNAEILIGIVNYMVEQIKEKAYHEGTFWWNARMRYIYHTTGPHCLNRFLRLPCNALWLAEKRLRFLKCNHFSQAHKLTEQDKESLDVISFESNSYFTKERMIYVPVGDGDAQWLPTLPLPKRLRGKHPREFSFEVEEFTVEK